MDNSPRKQSVFDKISEWFFGILAGSFIGRFFTSYEKTNAKFEKKANKQKNIHSPWRKKVIIALQNSKITLSIEKFMTFLLRISLREYGLLFFVMGAVVSILYPLNGMILFVNVSFEYFVYAMAILVCSIPLMFSAHSLAVNILSNKLVSTVLFDFLGIDSESVHTEAEKNRVTHPSIMALIGFVLGIASYFASPINIIIAILLVIFAYNIFKSPETGTVIIVFLLPFIPFEFLKVILIYVFACYLIKLFLGKRLFKLEYLDIFAFATIILMALFGINYQHPIESIPMVLNYIAIFISYFLFANIIRSKEWFRRDMISLTVTSLIVSLIAIIQAILGKIGQSVSALNTAFPYSGSANATFETSEALGQFMIIAAVFALANMISERSDLGKFGHFILLATFTATLILADTKSALVGFLIGVIFLLIIYNRNYLYLALVLALAIPIFYFALPDYMIQQIFAVGFLSDISFPKKFNYMKKAFALFLEKPLGIGVGSEVLDIYFPGFGGDYVDSLPISIMVELGIIATIAFLVYAVMFVRVILSYCAGARNKYRRVNGSAGFCVLTAIFSAGIFSNVWHDSRIMLISFICAALSIAYIKIEREERQINEKYVDLSSASIEIELSPDGERDTAVRRKYVRAPKLKKQKAKKAQVKEFTNTDEIIRIVDPVSDTEDDEE